MIKIEKTSIIGRYNLVDTNIIGADDDHYIRQLSIAEVRVLGKSIINLIQ